MRITIFAPYGPFSQESGVIYMLGNYLKSMFSDIVQLRCNGLFSVCERDSETNFKRDFDSCMLCMADQSHLQRWSGLSSIDASNYLKGDEVEVTRRWIQSIPDSELLQASYRGHNLFDLCEESFMKRFGVNFDLSNKGHVQTAKKMMMAAARMTHLVGNYYRSFTPDMCFVAGGNDLLSRSFVSALNQTHAEPVEFRWDMHKRTIHIKRARAEESISCELLLEGVSNMRADQSTWPDELLEIIDGILDYLDLKNAQLYLPIGHKEAV